MVTRSSASWIAVAVVALALGGGCVQHVNFSKQIFTPTRSYNILYEGPKAPVVNQTADGVEVRFDRHVVKLHGSQVTVDEKVFAIDPEAKAFDLRVNRENFKIIVNGILLIVQPT